MISGCYTSGVSISNSGDFAYTGGIVGFLTESEISGGCYTSGVSITTSGGSSHAGGIVGYSRGGAPLSGCSVSDVNFTDNGGTGSTVGGIVGLLAGEGWEISECSVSDVTNKGGQYSGGIVGWAWPALGKSLSITACYVSGGSVKGRSSNSYVGGISGLVSGGFSAMACYVFDVDLHGTAVTGSIVGKNTNSSSLSVTACYAGGRNYANIVANGTRLVTNSYFQAATVSAEYDADPTKHRKTVSALQTPTNTTADDAGSIYENWDIDLDNADGDDDVNTGGDDPWDFGTGSQYPVLKVIDANRDGTIDAVDDVSAQRN